jgi:hypothetical protein
MRKDSSVQELDELAKKAQSVRSKFEPTWFTNLAYYQGQQWVYYQRGRLYEPKLDPWRVTFTDNRLLGVVRTEVAKMTKQKPIFVATPTTGDEDDIASAMLLERALVHVWDELRLSRRQRAALMWSRICGAGFWKVYWDGTVGERRDVLLDSNGQVVLGQDGRPMDPQIIQQLPPEMAQNLQVKSIAQGECCVEVRSPLEVAVDPLAGEEGLISAEWLVEETVQSVDYVQQRWDVELSPDADAIAGLAESRMGPMSADAGPSSSYKGVKVREYWARPSSANPKGKYAVWAGGKQLAEKEPDDPMPYIMFPGIIVPGRFWPTSIVEQLRPVQTELNKTRSQIRENAARIGNPALLKNRLANVDYTGLPGEVIEYDDLTPNAVPTFLQPPGMPAYVEQEIDWLQQALQEISGQHEVSAGQAPPGVTAASAISLLQEQDDTRLGPDITEMEGAIGEAGEKIAKLIARYYTDERTIRIAGEDGDWDIQSFRGTMLEGAAKVSVQAGSAIPLSKAAKQAAMQQIITLFIQNGVPLSPRQLARFLKDMEVGGFERMVEQFNADEQQVNSENRRLGMGMPLPINSFDSDEAHVELHQEFMKSARYGRLDPQIHMLFEQHVMAHQQRVQQVQEAQMQQQIEMQKALQPERPPASGGGQKAA